MDDMDLDEIAAEYEPKPYWEEEAENELSNALSEVEKDHVRGAISVWTGYDPRDGGTLREEFDDFNSLYYKLIEVAESGWNSAVPWDKGPVFEASVEDIVADAVAEHDFESFFFRGQVPEEAEELIHSHDLLSGNESKLFTVDLSVINDELIKHLARHPELMHQLSPRKFEEVVAQLFKDMGYDVELTPPTKDGGFDIRAVWKTGISPVLTLVECKRYAPKNKVGVDIVRGLYGVVGSENATNGLIVTSSFFTAGATAFQKKNEFRLALADYSHLVDILGRYRKKC